MDVERVIYIMKKVMGDDIMIDRKNSNFRTIINLNLLCKYTSQPKSCAIVGGATEVILL